LKTVSSSVPTRLAKSGAAKAGVLINPSNPTAQAVLKTMIETGDYFFFALDSDRSATAFRSEIGKSSLAGLRANMSRIWTSTTTDAQYRSAVSQFARRPEPPGTLLTWVCQDSAGALDLAEDRLVLRPA